jgi:hypothetical protein
MAPDPNSPVTGLRGALASLAEASLAFLLVNLLLVVVMRFNGTAVFDQLSYLRWDSGHYVTIAAHGYELYPCKEPEFAPGQWCGNAGWFPAYPHLMRLVRPYTGRHYAVAGILISKVFFLGTLVLLAWAARSLYGPGRALPVVLAASVFPGAIYCHVVFPMAQFLFFSCLHLLLLLKRRDLLAGLAGAAAAASYSSGYLLAAVGAMYLLLTYESFGVLLRRALLVSGVTLLGVAVVVLIQYVEVGAWNAWLLVQSKYGWEPWHPFKTLAAILNPLHKNGPDTVVAVQNLAIAGLMFIAAVDCALHRGRDEAGTLFFVYACVFFLAPVLIVGPRLSYQRAFLLLMPATLLSARWPPPILSAITVVFAVLFPIVAVLFFNSAIV